VLPELFIPYVILDEDQKKFKDCFADNNKIGILKLSCQGSILLSDHSEQQYLEK